MAEYHTYLPAVMNTGKPMTGLARCYASEEDMERTKSGFYYDWAYNPASLSDSRYVPMSREGQMIDLPEGYSGYLLQFNEPDNIEPHGCGVSPEAAAPLYEAMVSRYPHAKIVPGGVTAGGYNWMEKFKSLITTVPHAWAVHAYIEGYRDVDWVEGFLSKVHGMLGGNIWVTEWAEVAGNTTADEQLATWMDAQPWIERWAYFTNRVDVPQPWYPQGWNVLLFDYSSGEPTAIGAWMMDYMSQRVGRGGGCGDEAEIICDEGEIALQSFGVSVTHQTHETYQVSSIAQRFDSKCSTEIMNLGFWNISQD
jgi:hypothetical protein